MALEQLAYDMLKFYTKHLPEDATENWQPGKVIDALVQYDPSLEEDYAVSIRLDGQDASKAHLLGEHRKISGRYIKKHYNKLSSLIHVPTPKQAKGERPSVSATREYLTQLLTEFEQMFSSTIQLARAETLEFQCSGCSGPIIRNIRVLQSDPFINCPSAGCAARYECMKKDDEWVVADHRVSIKCLSCKESTAQYGSVLVEGRVYKCENCKAEHVVKRRWVLDSVNDRGHR